MFAPIMIATLSYYKSDKQTTPFESIKHQRDKQIIIVHLAGINVLALTRVLYIAYGDIWLSLSNEETIFTLHSACNSIAYGDIWLRLSNEEACFTLHSACTNIRPR